MPESITAPMTFIGGERSDTRNGKERYVVHTNDGREFSCWSASVFEGVMAHLHESLNAKVYSKQGDNGRWWHTLDGLPDLGLEAPRQSGGGSTASPSDQSSGGSVSLDAIVPVLERIALALENLLQFQTERYLDSLGGSPEVPDDEPPE
jgi:hypothetical protein